MKKNPIHATTAKRPHVNPSFAFKFQRRRTMRTSYLKIRTLLGIVSLVTGLLAANFALFGWNSPNGFFYLSGEFVRYACAYGGFTAIIFGAMMIEEFLVLKASITSKRTAMQLAEDFGKNCSPRPILTQFDFLVETKEE